MPPAAFCTSACASSPALRVAHGDCDEVLKHLHIRRADDARVDPDLPDGPLPVCFNGDHSAPRGSDHGGALELVLNLLQPALHLLRLLHDLEHVHKSLDAISPVVP